jgi:hypothetical protein
MTPRYWPAALLAALTFGCGGGTTPPSGAQPPGAERTPKTATLETGAAVMQAKAPVDQIAIYMNGFHPSKADPGMQMEAHHYCNQVNEDLAQCVLFDGNTADARLMGIEYIVSAKLYDTLPADEKAYWHPHNYEILSGELRLPGLPAAAERETLEGKMNSYGKTWHTWMTGMRDRQPDPLPFGPAQLQWSFNRDGEAKPEMVAERDRRFGFNTMEERQARATLVPLAKPQGGVAAMADRFPSGTPVAGVTGNGDRTTHAVPTLSMQKQNASDAAAAAKRPGTR